MSAQGFTDYEHILVNDGSVIEVDISGDKRIVIKDVHNERVNALRLGMSKATGEWMTFLDADDELLSHSLEMFNQAIEKYPKFKVFNFGSVHLWKDYTLHVRGAFQPKQTKFGHEPFGPGQIVNGTFIFKRSVYEKEGGFPEMDIIGIDTTDINYGGVRNLCMCSPWDFSAYAQMEFPEIRPLFNFDKEAEPYKVIRELGNPWGNDFYMFYKYTRKHHSKAFDVPCVLIHHDGKNDDEGHYVE